MLVDEHPEILAVGEVTKWSQLRSAVRASLGWEGIIHTLRLHSLDSVFDTLSSPLGTILHSEIRLF